MHRVVDCVHDMNGKIETMAACAVQYSTDHPRFPTVLTSLRRRLHRCHIGSTGLEGSLYNSMVNAPMPFHATSVQLVLPIFFTWSPNALVNAPMHGHRFNRCSVLYIFEFSLQLRCLDSELDTLIMNWASSMGHRNPINVISQTF